MFKSCMEFRKSLPESERDKYPIYTRATDLVVATLCDMDQNGLPKKVCLHIVYSECGVCLLQFHENEMSTKGDSPDLKWKTNKNMLILKKPLSLVNKKSKPGELFSYLRKLLQTYTGH